MPVDITERVAAVVPGAALAPLEVSVFATVAAEHGLPAAMVLDRVDTLWVACWFGYRVLAFSPGAFHCILLCATLC